VLPGWAKQTTKFITCHNGQAPNFTFPSPTQCHPHRLPGIRQSINQASKTNIYSTLRCKRCLFAHLKMYKCLRGLAPDYLSRLSVRPRLRSSDDHQLLIPQTRTVTLGTCTFNTSGPASWNALPAVRRDPAVILGTFRQMLKSFLF